MKALGLIEVNGYLAGIEAADAALKAASVTLIALEKVNAGITNVQITGDIGAVNAAVEAGKTAADSLGMLRAYHVIPRLHEETLKLFPSINKEVKKGVSTTANDVEIKVEEGFKAEVIDTEPEIIDIEPEIKEEIQEIKKEDTQKNEDYKTQVASEEKAQEDKENKIKKIEDDKKQKKGESVIEENKKINKEENLVDYSSMRVDELRKLVSNLNLPHLTNKQIKFEKKDELIKILLEYGDKGGK